MLRFLCQIIVLSLIAASSLPAEDALWRRLTTDGLFKQRPSFSPDAKSVVFSRHIGDRIQLISRNLETGDESRVTDRSDPEYDAVFSPDGQSLLFAFDLTTPNQGNIEVYSIDLNSKELKKIAGDVGGLSHEESPCWSPDGTRIAFTSTRDGNQELYVASADGSEPLRLTSDPAIDAHPAWAPDGKLIVFSTNRWGDLELATIQPDGTNLTRLTDSHGLDDYPAWSPDGMRLAFASNRDGQLEIYVMKSDGSEPHNVTQSEDVENFPAWSPSGDLGFISGRDGGFDLYLISGNAFSD